MPIPFSVRILNPVFLNDVARGIMFSFDFMYSYNVSQNESGFFKRGLIVTEFKKSGGEVIYIDKQQIDLSKYPSDKLRVNIIENMNQAENTMQVESFLESYSYSGFDPASQAGSIISNSVSVMENLQGEQFLEPTPTPEPIPEPEPIVYPVSDMGIIDPVVTTPVITTPVITTPVITTPVVTPIVYPVSDMGIIVPVEVLSILTKFDNKELSFISFDFDFWFQYDTNSVRNGTINSQDFLNAYNGFVNRELIIDKTIVISPIPELPPQLETESCQQYRTRVKNLGFSHEWLSPCPETVPALPNKDSYEIKLTSASYMGTSKGKTVNIQTSINLTGIPSKSIYARIQIKNSEGTDIYTNFQNLSVGGGQTFPLVFNIPDLGKEEEGISGGEATAVINYKIFLWESLENPTALAPFPLIGKLVYDSEVIRPDPKTGEVEVTTSLLGKVMGVTALIGTLALLGSKRR